MSRLSAKGRTTRSRERPSRGSRQFWWQIATGVLALLLLAGVLAGVYYLTRLPAVTIETITVSGGERMSHEEVREAVADELRGSYLLIVPRRFTYLYPKDDIHAALDAFPQLYDVSVSRTDRTTLSVTFREYVPHALWCAEEASTMCLYLTRSGVAFAPAPSLSGSALLRYSTAGREPQVGERALPRETLARLSTFARLLEAGLDFRVYAVHRTAENDIRVDLHSGGELVLPSEVDPENIYTNLESVLAAEEFSDIRDGSFNYIDLRFGEKVFVREDFARASGTATGTATSTEESVRGNAETQ